MAAMLRDYPDDDWSEPTERDYREGVIILVILLGVLIFEFHLKSRLPDPLRGKTEITLVLLSIGMIHLFCSHLLAFLYNSKHLRMVPFHAAGMRQARPRHARAVGVIFSIAAVIVWFVR
jgi:hypothetical protein